MTPTTAVQAVDWWALSPVLGPVVAIVAVLLLDAARPQAGRVTRLGHDLLALAGLVAAGAAVLWSASDRSGIRDAQTFCVPGAGLQLPACAYTASSLTLALQAVVVVGAVLSLLLAVDGPAARDRAPHHVLLLTVVAGALAVAGARDLVTLVVALETASLPVIGLVALRRDAASAQGALTLLVTAIGSLGMLLLGVALLLLASGTLHVTRIAMVLGDPGLPAAVRAVALLGVVLAVSGIGFKLSAVPFHWWTADTYAGAPLPVAAFLSVVSKAAGVGAVAVLLGLAVPVLGDAWAPLVGLVAAVTMTVGNVVALRQRVAVRLLAWSAIAQAGWVLLPFGAAAVATPSMLREAVAASVGYLVAYAAAGLTAFAVVVVVGRNHPAAEEHAVEAYRGLFRREPVASVILAFALSCLAGLPPGVVGLVAKVVAFRPLVDAGAWWLAAVAVVNVVLGIVYYLRWAALLFAPARGRALTWRVRPSEGLALGAAATLTVALSVWPQAVAGLVPHLLR